MKFTCEKHLLSTAVDVTAKAAAAKSPNAALEGLLIEANPTGVKITGYDLVKGIYTHFPADVQENGSVILSAKLLGNIVHSLPDDFVTLILGENDMVRIVSGHADFTIASMDSDLYPELPSVENQKSIEIPQNTMKSIINQTSFAVSRNEARPVYTGALFELQDKKLTVVSVDGYRLAMRREELKDGELEDCSFIAPGSALDDLEKICVDSDEKVKICLGKKHISFKVGSCVLITRRLEGDFLDYDRSIPKDFKYKLKVRRLDLLKCVDRVSLIIDDRIKNPIRCVFSDDRVSMFSTALSGKGEDTCYYKGLCDNIEIGFNNKYLQEALRAATTEELLICLNTASSPCVLIPSDEDEKFLYMILPVRLKA